MSARQKNLILIACILGSGMAFLDGTVVNVALPAIRADLHAGLATQQWVVEAYLLTLGSLLLVGGSLGDVFGRHRVFALGVAAFGVTSALSAAAPDGTTLIVARGLQGVAGALLVPSTMGIIVSVFPEGERGAAIGSWTAWTGIATVVGPLGGGALVQAASWRWVFAINIPLALVTLWLIARAVPALEVPKDQRPKVDVIGAAMCALGLGGPVFALIQQPSWGWGDPRILASLIGGLALLAALVEVERRVPEPMLPLHLFRLRNFAVGNAATLAMYAGLNVMLFFLVLFLQQVAGYRPVVAGLALLPTTLLMFALSKRMGAWADRIGPRPFMTVGPLLAAGGLALLLRLGPDADYLTEVLPGVAVFGLGLSATVAPLTAAVLGGVDERHAGVASGVNNAVARVAGLLAVAALGAVVSSQFASQLDRHVDRAALDPPGRAALAQARSRPLAVVVPRSLPPGDRAELRTAMEDASESAFHLAIGLGAALVALAAAISFAGIRDPHREVACDECPGGPLVGAPEDVAVAA